MTDEELSIARYNSSVRLLSTWEDIVNRYKDVPAEEDDEIDLRTGKLIRDRGKLKNMTGTRRFGFFVGALHGEDDVEESSEEEPDSDDAQIDDNDNRAQPTSRSRATSRAGSPAGSRAPTAGPTEGSFFAPRRQVEMDPKDLETFLQENRRLMGDFVDEDDDFEGIDEVTVYDGETDRESVYGRTDVEDFDSSDDDSSDSSDASGSDLAMDVDGTEASRFLGPEPASRAPAHGSVAFASDVDLKPPVASVSDFDHNPVLPDRPRIPGYPSIEWHRKDLPTAASLPLLHHADLYTPGFRYGTSSWTSISPHVLFNVPRDHDPVNVALASNEPFVPEGLDLPEGSIVYNPTEVIVRTAAEARMYAIDKRDKMRRLWTRKRDKARAAEAQRTEQALNDAMLVDELAHPQQGPSQSQSQSQSQPTSSFFAPPDSAVSSWATGLANLLQARPAGTVAPHVPPMAEFYPAQPNLCRVCLAYGRDLVASRCPGGTGVDRCTGGDPKVTTLVFPKRCVRCLFQGREELSKVCRGRKKPRQCINSLEDMGGLDKTCERCKQEGRLEEMYICKGITGQWKCDQGRAGLEREEEKERKALIRRGETGESDYGDSTDDDHDHGQHRNQDEVVLSDEDEAETEDETEEDEWESDKTSAFSDIGSDDDGSAAEGDGSDDDEDGDGESGRRGKGKRPERIRPKRSLPKKTYALSQIFADVYESEEASSKGSDSDSESDSD